jgi:hypothetical protein
MKNIICEELLERSSFIVDRFISEQPKDALFYEWAVKSILFGFLSVAQELNQLKNTNESEDSNAT